MIIMSLNSTMPIHNQSVNSKVMFQRLLLLRVEFQFVGGCAGGGKHRPLHQPSRARAVDTIWYLSWEWADTQPQHKNIISNIHK